MQWAQWTQHVVPPVRDPEIEYRVTLDCGLRITIHTRFGVNPYFTVLLPAEADDGLSDATEAMEKMPERLLPIFRAAVADLEALSDEPAARQVRQEHAEGKIP